MSYLFAWVVLTTFYATCNTWYPPNSRMNLSPAMHLVLHKVCIAYPTPFEIWQGMVENPSR